MKNLSIDIETYSSSDLVKHGMYRYAEAIDFEILLFAYAIDHGAVNVVDVAQGESVPQDIVEALTDNTIIKWAFNAQFERICISRWLRDTHPEAFFRFSTDDETMAQYLEPQSWRCSRIWAAYMGLPLSLEGVGAVLQLQEQKISEGKDLIRYFCLPCRPTKTNGGRTRNLPIHNPEKWRQFKAYNKRDVEVEVNIQKTLQKFPVPEFLWEEYYLDQTINDRGIAVDEPFVQAALAMDDISRTSLVSELKTLTGLENPNSVQQMQSWLLENGVKTASLDKKSVKDLLPTVPAVVQTVLTLRQKLAKSSVKKYQAMASTMCADGRARGMFQFYGANRTGRFAGRHIQLQNLPQNHIPELAQARDLVCQGNYTALTLLYDSVSDVLSQLIRTAFIPQRGMKFIVADFSAIEARVLSWLSGEVWRSEVFAKNGDIYCASASAMFGVPVEKHGRNAELRQKGKIAELALGYGGSVGALTAMGALDMGLVQTELQPLVDSWRSANPHIVSFWWAVDRAVKETIRKRVPVEVNGIRFICRSGLLFITLPSGRKLAYVKPKIGTNKFGGESVTYEGIGNTKKWERLESYGPKFVENIVQAISRDILCFAMKTLQYCAIVGHVHDELIIECDKRVSVDTICELMGRTPSWAEGLLLRADGYECEFYKKD